MTTPELALRPEVEPFDYLMFRWEGNPRLRSPITAVSMLDTIPGIVADITCVDWSDPASAAEAMRRLASLARDLAERPEAT